jgi:hypothetical protein
MEKVRNCRNSTCKGILPSGYKKVHCEACLEIDRKKANTRNEEVRIQQEQELANAKVGDKVICQKCHQPELVKGFMTKQKPPKQSTKCQHCYNGQAKVESGREDRDQKEYYKEYESRPEVKERREEYRPVRKRFLEENPEISLLSDATRRNKKIVTEGDKYWDHKLETQQEWKAKNPEKLAVYYEKGKTSEKRKISTVKGASSRGKGIPNLLTDHEISELLHDECYYCEAPAGERFSGVDRLNSNEVYINGNAESCCKQCNYAKGGISVAQFVSQAAHIVIFNLPELKDLATRFCLPIIQVYSPSSFESVKRRAAEKGLDFDLTEDQYTILRNGHCYLCGVKPNKGCGIDRFDNFIGYIFLNCRSCCNDCNMMKRDESYDSFIQRCIRIIHRFQDRTNLPTVSRQKRMEKSIFVKPKATLTRREVSAIYAKHYFDNSVIIVKRKLGPLIEQDSITHDAYEKTVEDELARALQKKIEALEQEEEEM